ncbi:MAG: S-adenosylmethionine decarboxylase [Burkholderiales bacterium]
MKDLAPEIPRIRLLIEGFYSGDMDEARVIRYLFGVAEELGLRVYGKPTVHSPAGKGSKQNQGFDAFIPLIDSGISLYVWSGKRFFSALIYSCKPFDAETACVFTQTFFDSSGVESAEF